MCFFATMRRRILQTRTAGQHSSMQLWRQPELIEMHRFFFWCEQPVYWTSTLGKRGFPLDGLLMPCCRTLATVARCANSVATSSGRVSGRSIFPASCRCFHCRSNSRSSFSSSDNSMTVADVVSSQAVHTVEIKLKLNVLFQPEQNRKTAVF